MKNSTLPDKNECNSLGNRVNGQNGESLKQCGCIVRSSGKSHTWKPNDCVKLQESLGMEEIPITIPTLLEEAAEKYSKKPALAVMEGGQWKMVKFREYSHNVRTVAKAFLKLGLQRYHSVCIIGGNSPEWFYFNLAAIMAGGIATGIYSTNSAEACLHCLKTSNANIVVIQNGQQLEKIWKIKEQAPLLKTFIQYSGTPKYSSVFSWEDILKIGNEALDDELNDIINGLAANECCTVLFTSGTTSLPKAVMMSHDNLIFKTKMSESVNRFKHGNRRILSYLPLSHVAAQAFDLYQGLLTGACVYFADENALRGSIVENLKAVQPTEFLAVPRIWEKIRECIETYVNNLSISKPCIFNITKEEDSIICYSKENEKYDNAQWCAKIKEMVGFHKCNRFYSAAAPISVELKEYFANFDIHLSEICGMTETCGAYMMNDVAIDGIYRGGKPIPGVRTKIHQPNEKGIGEVLVYGRNVFMGYMNDFGKTKSAFDDEGYLRTGDLGKYDSNLGLHIVGRIKDLIITAGGENIAPALIELQVKIEIPVISQAVLVGDGRKFLSLLITLKCNKDCETGLPTDELAPETKSWCRSLGHKFDTVSDIIKNRPSKIYNAIQEGINRANTKAISSAQRIQKFTILPRDFSSVTGEIGPTAKLIRSAVYEKYEDEIQEIYSK